MGRGKSVSLGHVEFPTQQAAKQYFRDLLARYEPEDVILEGSSDFRDVRALIERHPERDQKVGCGIAAFIVRLDENRNRMFWLRRSDGSETDFSFYSCVSGQAPCLRREFAEAARYAVHQEMKEHKERYFEQHANAHGLAPCQQTGQMMTMGEAHVDHHPRTFDQLVTEFLQAYAITPNRDILSAPADNQKTTTFICSQTEQQFVEFHRANATLMVVSKSVNLGRPRSK